MTPEAAEPIEKALGYISMASVVIRNLPEVPGYNGSILMMDDEEAERIDKELTEAFAILCTELARQQEAPVGGDLNWRKLVEWWESGAEDWEALKALILETYIAATPAPPKQQTDSGRGECGVVPQPLTDDEIIDIWAGVSTGHDDTINIIELARAIEAAHGIGPAPLQRKEAGV